MSLARHPLEKEHSAIRRGRIDEILMKVKIGKDAASLAVKEQYKELNYDDQSQNRGIKPRFSRMFQKIRGASWKLFEKGLGARTNKERNI